jgi:hypothetical protein
MDISRQVSSAALVDVSAGYCQGALAVESVIIITKMRKHNRSVMVVEYRTPCAIPPRNIYSRHIVFMQFPYL